MVSPSAVVGSKPATRAGVVGYRLAQTGAGGMAVGGVVDAFVPRLLPHHEMMLGVAHGSATPGTSMLVLLLLHALGVSLAATGIGAFVLLAAWRTTRSDWFAYAAALIVFMASGMNAWSIHRVNSPLYLGPLACVLLVMGGVAMITRRS